MAFLPVHSRQNRCTNTTPHNPAARVDCLHMVGDRSWFTTDICCRSCLGKYGLTTSIEYYLSACGDITLVQRDMLTGEYEVMF
jgi:hypothetical protein